MGSITVTDMGHGIKRGTLIAIDHASDGMSGLFKVVNTDNDTMTIRRMRWYEKSWLWIKAKLKWEH